MARHRNVRNIKSIDYDDDYDIYGQSYEDDYGVSPGTMAQYTYSRSSGKNVDLSSYIPSEATVKEDNEELECNQTQAIEKSSVSTTAPKQHPINFKTKIQCYTSIRNAVGEYFSSDVIEETAEQFSYNAEKTIDYLLNSSSHHLARIATDNNTTSLSRTPPKAIPNASASALPQRSARGRRNKANEHKSLNIVEASNDKSNVTINVKSNDSKAVKIGTTSNTPIKTGFHLATNNLKGKHSPNISEQRRRSEVTLTKNDSNSLTKIKPNSSFSSLSSVLHDNVDSATSTPIKSSKALVDYKKEYENRSKNSKQQLSMVVIGHVDAGKSTMMGHLLFRKGMVSKRVIHKYEQESKKLGKSSFAFAWVLDETGEERERGVTMDVAHNYFETDNRIITLMDAPGHRDFIPNMITGASQADVAVLVVGASTGEFEAGFGVGGQTREHALLVRSLGVAQLAVAVNKLDTVNWSKERFDEIVGKLKHFLKQAGFRDSDVTYVPVSGLLGENLSDQSTESALCSWYKGPSLVQVIDEFRPPQRPIDYPFRFCVNDVFRGQGSGIYLSGKVESGGVCPNTKVMVMPAGEKGLIKAVESSDEKGRVEFALAGEHATLVLSGVEMNKINKGSVICDVDNPIRCVTRLQARVIVFNTEVPITKGFPVELHYKAVSEPAVFKKLISRLHKSTGEVIAKKPRVLLKSQNALVQIETARAVCLEEYSSLKELGRFTLRYGGSTIAACVVTKLL